MAQPNKLKKFVSVASLALAVGGFGYGVHKWKNHFMERGFYVIKSSIKQNTLRDDYRMAIICTKLKDLRCRYKTLSSAYKKAPQNDTIVGEYAIMLSDAKKHEQAVLTFQKYFSVADGSRRHFLAFARSLEAREYIPDAKTYYYKALKMSPQDFSLAEEFIGMLRKHNEFGEALSIIGHYNLTQPKTRKYWARLGKDVKAEFQTYQNKYQIEQMTVSKMGSYFFAPATIEGSMDTNLFIVKPDSDYTTLDIDYLAKSGIPFVSKGEVTVNATNGTELSGTKIIIPSISFGGFQLKNVEAVACSNCAFVAGKSILGQLSLAPSKANKNTVGLLSISKKMK